jgi:hypothetical protein
MMRERDFRTQPMMKVGRKYLIKKVEGVFKFPYIGSFYELSENVIEIECVDVCKEYIKIQYLKDGVLDKFISMIVPSFGWVERDSVYVIGEIQISDKDGASNPNMKPDMKIEAQDLFSKDMKKVMDKLNELVNTRLEEEKVNG